MALSALQHLLAGNPNAVAKLVRGIERAVQRSYDADFIRDGEGKVITTEAEKKRRVTICLDATVLLRRDLKWSVSRIVDELPRMLRTKLDGGEWNPEAIGKRGSWFGAA